MDFVPNNEDMLRSYIRTAGIYKVFLRRDMVDCCIHDCEGTTGLASSAFDAITGAKWVGLIRHCHRIVFVASLSDFDEHVNEDLTSVSNHHAQYPVSFPR